MLGLKTRLSRSLLALLVVTSSKANRPSEVLRALKRSLTGFSESLRYSVAGCGAAVARDLSRQTPAFDTHLGGGGCLGQLPPRTLL